MVISNPEDKQTVKGNEYKISRIYIKDMTSENEDIDNERIRTRVTEYSKFPTENEDIDNMRRCVNAGIPHAIIRERKPDSVWRPPGKELTPYQRQHESWRLAPAWRPENASSLKCMHVQTKK